MRLRHVLALTAALALVLPASPGAGAREAHRPRPRGGLPRGFVPAVARKDRVGRYFVVLRDGSLAERLSHLPGGARGASAAEQRAGLRAVLAGQEDAIRAAEAAGGRILYRYARVVNGFSVRLDARAAASLAAHPDVRLVEPVGIVARTNETSVPFIGAPKVWRRLGAQGRGMTVAVVDTGVDYTHAAFGGEGTADAYRSNDPTVLEPGTFPTRKVIGGYDFVGEDYDVLDDDPSNDTPVPDPDPLDEDGHGSHTAGTCCGRGVPGSVGRGVAPRARILAVKVWDEGNSTADVLVAGYEFAVDPNGDGRLGDGADVLSFSGGVSYGAASSTEAIAAQGVVDLGVVFVASAGNEGNQPLGGSAYVLGTPASAPGVIAVAASIDRFVAQTMAVDEPAGFRFPEGGIVVHQDWSAPIDADLSGELFDAREVAPPSDPSGEPSPADAPLCGATPQGSPFEGKVVLVFKGSTGEGDCSGSEKVFRAQEAGAVAVVLWSGFGGLPFGLGPGDFADLVAIPAVMVSGPDGAALATLASPDAPSSYNAQLVRITIDAEGSVIPGFEDRLTDFTSEGPARITHALKPDVSAPGADIRSAAVGTGDQGILLSGTSMAAPHVSGVAALLRELHPGWTPARVKAAIMNQATQEVADNNGDAPVSATIMGAGRVQAYESARAVSLATPGSLSFGLRAETRPRSLVRAIRVWNLDGVTHGYTVRARGRYSDLDPDVATATVSLDGRSFGASRNFTLGPGRSRRVWVRLSVDPDRISRAEQMLGWYYFLANADGNVEIRQRGPGRDDTLHVPWHVVPLAASANAMSRDALDLADGRGAMRLLDPPSAGAPAADLYLLGATDGRDGGGEEDVAAIGARSFTGPSIDGVPEGVPAGTDPLVGLTWLGFLTDADEPTEPVEFGVAFRSVHDTTETLEVDVLVDLGADGVFADPELGADVLVVKLPAVGGEVCVYDLSLPDPFDACAARYFPDYTNYEGGVVGIAVDARAIGLSDAEAILSYQVVACTGVFAGDVPQQVCDVAGELDPETGTYGPRLDATDPALRISPLVCRGFFGGRRCDPVRVSVGSAAPGDDPGILAVFPNNAPDRAWQVVRTTT